MDELHIFRGNMLPAYTTPENIALHEWHDMCVAESRVYNEGAFRKYRVCGISFRGEESPIGRKTGS